MKYVIATAGHVDHGKSTLVTALTGIDPDRLAEEKQRQMTIDLGFAWFTLPSGDEVGIVDVPGHRDFIRNMLAGIGGVDAVLLVVAADEGVMPQTLEHINILDLLEIERGLIVITKTDLIQGMEWLEMVKGDVRHAVQGTALEKFPIVPVSAITKDGFPELLDLLQKILATVDRKVKICSPHLAVDRVFSLKGFGTVVTGTLLGGEFKVGEEVQILPLVKVGRIRGIETHKQKVETAEPGSRVALNISGIEVHEIKRGDVVVKPGTVQPTLRCDAQVRLVPSASVPLKHNATVKLYHGTSEVLARVRTLGKDAILPGELGLVQIELSAPIVAWQGDRFILRWPSPPQTIGGGQIINAQARRRYKRYAEKTIASLNAQLAGSFWDVFLITVAKKRIVSKEEMEKIFLEKGFIFKDIERAFYAQEELIVCKAKCSRKEETLFFSTKEEMEKLTKRVENELEAVYQRSSLLPGIQISELCEELGIELCVCEGILANGYLGKNFGLKRGYLFRKGHTIQFSPKDLQKIQSMNALFEKNPFAPPALEVIQEIVGNDLLEALLFLEELISVDDSIVFRKKEFEYMKKQLSEFLERNGAITLSQFRDVLNTSRKYALAFLEYMDQVGVTERVGEARRLKRSSPAEISNSDIKAK